MRLIALGAGAIGAGVAAAAVTRALEDDSHLRLRNTDQGQLQHSMFAVGGIGGLTIAATVAMAIAHATGHQGLASAAAGASAGLAAGMLGALVGARIARSPDELVPQVTRL